MIDPRTITTSGIKTAEIIRDTGAGGFTVAKIKASNGSVHHGLRWNGEEGEDKGFPTSRGYPVWMVIPEEIAMVVDAHYRARDFD